MKLTELDFSTVYNHNVLFTFCGLKIKIINITLGLLKKSASHMLWIYSF